MGFLFWAIAGKTLLPNELGIVSTSVNLVMVLGGVSLLGLSLAAWKLISEYLAKKEIGKINSLVRFSLKVILLSNVVILVIMFSLSSFFSSILKIPVNVIIITGVALLVYTISSQFGFIIYGFQNMKKILITDFIGQTIKVIVSIFLIFLGFKYFGPLIGFLIGFVVVALLRVGSIPLKGEIKKIDQKEIMLIYALPAFIATIFSLMFLNGQYVLLSMLKTPTVTGIFTVAMLLATPLAVIPQTISNALLPIISQLSVDRNSKKTQAYLIWMVLRYSLIIILPLAIFLILFSKPVILLFSRAEYLSASQLFPILALGSIIYGCGSIFLGSLYAMGKTKIYRNILIVTTVAFLVFAIPLIHVLSGLGSAIAYILSATFLALLSFFYTRKFLKSDFHWKNIMKLIMSILISFGFLYLVTRFTQGLFIGIVFAVISCLIYLLILIPLKFYTIDDIKILDFLIKRTPILKKEIAKLRNSLSKFTG
jgi:O-antigen/teichoic acid export membrane protein